MMIGTRNVCLLLGLTLFISTVSASPLPPYYTDAALRAVHFVDGNEGWAAGDEGVIWHTIDGGKSWERQKTGTRASLRSLQFLSPYTGFAAGRTETPTGSSAIILRTTDGGQTWQELLASVLPGLNHLHFFDERNGIACGDSSPAFPGGIFITSDGGHSWRPKNSFTSHGWLAAAFADPTQGCLIGRSGQLAPLTDGKIESLDRLPTGGRALRAIACQGNSAVLVGDGGLLMQANDWPRRSFASSNLPLPAAARAVCNFHTVARAGERIMVAGNPGSMMLISPDAGKSWQIQATPTSTTLHAITMISEQKGWAVGDLGTILHTSDGGATWSVQKTGGQRLALLCAHASATNMPFSILPSAGQKEGYLVGGLAITTADLTNADPRRATDDSRMTQAMRVAGGATGESFWSFPLPEHCRGLSPEQLLAFWDSFQGGKAREQLLAQLVMTIRSLRPDVIITDTISPQAGAAEQIVRGALQEAFTLAEDPKAFPEQLSSLHLQLHAVKKLYAIADRPEESQVVQTFDAFEPELAGTARSCFWEATRLMAQLPVSQAQFRLISQRIPDAEKHAGLMDGCDLARGGTARRSDRQLAFTSDYLEARRKAFTQLGAFDDWLNSLASTPVGDFDASWSTGRERLLAVPDDLALPSLLDKTREFVNSGKTPLARELYRIAIERYPAHPATSDAHRWLATYHASSEAIRRIELGELPIVRPTTFVQLPELPASSPPDLIQVAFTEAIPAKTRVKFRSSEAEMLWRLNGADGEERFYALNPFEAREPVFALTGNSARMRMGLTADAERALMVYFHRVLGRSTPGMNPWYDAVDSEIWLANRPKGSSPAKPLTIARKLHERPQLDGKLDEAAWKQAELLPIAVGPAELGARYRTDARFAYDADFLYISVRCVHPEGEQKAKATVRQRDEDLNGYDRVEVLLDQDRDYQSHWRLCVDQRGCVAEDASGDRSWNPRWFVSTASTSTGWTTEIAIPVVELSSGAIRDQHVWAMNVVRVLPGRGVLSWCGPADAKPRPEGMGLLEFRSR